MSASPLTSADPQRLGRYELLSRLGVGGMGVVYLARTPGGSRVAVKAVTAALAHDATFRTRFAREVAALRQVNVPGTARLLDADPDGEVPYLVTEYLEGVGLDERIRLSGPLAFPELSSLLAGVAETLNAIHLGGLVHRDLKPSNVLLTSSGPRVLDFGIAAALDETALTLTGLVGTPGWLAPEQLEGASESPTSDVYCLGALAVFAATGEGPFGIGRPEVLAARALTQSPDVSGVPGQLRPLVARMLARDPQARPSAARVLAELTGAGDGTDEVTRRPELPTRVLRAPNAVPELGTSGRWARRVGAGVLSLGALLLAGFILGSHHRGQAPSSASRPTESASPPSQSPSTSPFSEPSTSTTGVTSSNNPFISEVWGSNAVPFGTPDASVSYTGTRLTRRSLGGARLLVPAGWAVSDESIPSDHIDLIAYDPANPSARIEISGSGCVGCVQSPVGGNADPKRVLPTLTVSSFVFDHGLRAGFQEHSADGYDVNGVVVILGSISKPRGYYYVRVAFPPPDHATASEILNSVEF